MHGRPTETSPVPPSEAEESIVIQVDEAYEGEVDTTDLRAAVIAALSAEDISGGELTLVITGDEEVADLNRAYRDVDGPTDVLSFPAREETPGFVTAPEMAAYLGDVIIALPYTQRQAEALGRPLRDELRLLAIHGVLHLLGYDHADAEEEVVMWAKQDAILATL